MAEKVLNIQMDKLIGFRNHPFQVKGDSLKALCESIRDYGVLSPLLLSSPLNTGRFQKCQRFFYHTLQFCV